MYIPSLYCYCNNTTPGNAQACDAGPFTFFFSYRTLVGFRSSEGTIVRENEWGPTTGKHLNAIDGGEKRDRISGEAFRVEVARIMGAIA